MRAEAACFHCGLPLPAASSWTALVDGQPCAVCCPGCKAVAETIAAGGLSSYYHSRTTFAAQATPTVRGELQIYDRPEVQTGFVRSAGPDERETTLIIEGITCAACVWLNEKHLAGLPGVTGVEINYATRRARVRWDASRIALSEILAQIESIGYHAWPATSANAEQARNRETRAALWRLFVAGFGMMQVMMYALPAYLAEEGDIGEDTALLMRLASLVLTVPVVFFSAAPFFRGAWRDLRRLRPGMDVPVALGIGVAFGASLYATFTGGREVYYDSIAMFVFFLLAARWFEMRARQKAAASLEYLDKALPLAAHRLRNFPTGFDTEEIPAVSLHSGDLVLVKPGEAFPGDGNVVQGETQCDESLLTGESAPVHKRSGEPVFAGSFNRLSQVIVRMTRVGEQTCVSGVRRLAERASAQRPGTAELSEAIASRFVAGVLVFAAASAVLWLFLDPSRALWIAIVVLVVSCPCALSLATPTAMVVAIGSLSRRGVVVARAHAIDALAGITHVVFDKTGTLTEGRFGVVATTPQAGIGFEQALALAAALERDSEHPIATAFAAATLNIAPITASMIRNVPGAGVEAFIDGVCHRLGTQPFVAGLVDAVPTTESERASVTRVWLGRQGKWLASFDLSDQLRPEAQAVVRRLQAEGKHVMIWSGDALPAVRAVAWKLGVDDFQAGLLPQDKQSRMLALQALGAVVAMIGDGVNDAPVLAQAHLSIAMGSGALLTQAHADVVLLSGRLQSLVEAIDVAVRTRRIVRQNLAWAVGYNAVALSFAAAGMVTPWLAGIGMGTSSLIVVLNALRVRARRDEGRGKRGEGMSAMRDFSEDPISGSLPLTPRPSPLVPRP
ncbi:MAG: heavy metal translocating P-type ATPase [Betaproteobacteria bacterium]